MNLAEKFGVAGGVAVFLAICSLPVAWVTHVVWTVRVLMSGAADAGQIALAILGLFVPPLGVIHGFVLWFA